MKTLDERDIQKIITQAANVLRGGGLLAFEHGYNQAAAVRQLLETAGFVEVVTQQDYAGCDRITAGIKA